MIIGELEIQAAPGKITEVGSAVAAMRDAAVAASDHPWSAWSVVATEALGCFVMASTFDSFAEFTAVTSKLGQSSDMHQAEAQLAGNAIGPPKMSMYELVGQAGERPSGAQVVMETSAQIIGDRLAEATQWAGDVVTYLHEQLGISSLWAMSMAGRMFEVSFVVPLESPADVDAVNAKLAVDATYAQMLQDAGSFFLSGQAMRRIAMRMG